MISLTEQVAELFERKQGQWIDARELMRVGGAMAWRTRVSEVRHKPFHMTIENVVKRVKTKRGVVKTSHYRYQP